MGLQAVYDATLVAKLVLLLLVCMSVTSWTLIIQRYLALSAAAKKAKLGLERFTEAKDLREAVVPKAHLRPVSPRLDRTARRV